MKSALLFFPITALSLLCSCSGTIKEKDREIDSLRNALAKQQCELEMSNEFIDIYKTNVDSVIKSDYLIFSDAESPVLTKEKIKENLAIYNKILDNQKERIKELEVSLAKSNSENAKKLKAAIARMQAQLDAKDEEIKQLQAKLDSKNINIAELKSSMTKMQSSISSLEETTKQQEEALVEQDNLLNTGYVLIGSTSDLKAKGLLKGGLLSKKKLDVNSIDENKFEKIDMRSATKFEIPSKKAKVMTAMPTNSYTIVSDGSSCTLVITDPGRFWSQTSYLIVAY